MTQARISRWESGKVCDAADAVFRLIELSNGLTSVVETEITKEKE